MSAGPLVALDDVRGAAERIGGLIVRTPLVELPELSDRVGHEVRLKCENLQRAGSFKARGALNFVRRLSDEEAARGLITYSSGNHGQALSLAAKLRGVRAVIVMPTTAPPVKVEGCKLFGAEVVLEGTTSAHRKERAEAILDAEGLTMVPPFDHPWIIAGQGTLGLEILEDWPEVETVVTPIGGGGMVSGVSAALRRLRPGIRIVGVEPVGAPSMRAALDAGEPVVIPRAESVADGLLPTRVGDLTYAHVRDLVDDVVTVDDGVIRDAARFLLLRGKLVVEYSGAATVAALLSGALRSSGRSPGRTVAVLSGGNMDPTILAALASSG